MSTKLLDSDFRIIKNTAEMILRLIDQYLMKKIFPTTLVFKTKPNCKLKKNSYFCAFFSDSFHEYDKKNQVSINISF